MKSISEIFLLHEIISKTSLQRVLKHDDKMMRIFIIAHVINDAAVRARETQSMREFSFVYLNFSCFISYCEHAAAERMRARKFFHQLHVVLIVAQKENENCRFIFVYFRAQPSCASSCVYALISHCFLCHHHFLLLFFIMFSR